MKSNVQAQQVQVKNNEQTIVILGKASALTFGGGGNRTESMFTKTRFM